VEHSHGTPEATGTGNPRGAEPERGDSLTKKMIQRKLQMRTFGVTVVPVAEWPWPTVGGAGREVTCRLDTKLRTTQAAVWADIVDGIASDIEDGQPTKQVELVFRKGLSWIIDGHHTLAAYRLLGRSAPCVFYPTGPDEIPPPKLFGRGTRR
jgi:hypothetical protein